MIPSAVRIFVCTEEQDMRRSFDALALAVRERLDLDPESGALFVFASKRGNRIKVLWFDHNGYCLLYKRLHRALFELPDSGAVSPISGTASLRIDPSFGFVTRKVTENGRRCAVRLEFTVRASAEFLSDSRT